MSHSQGLGMRNLIDMILKTENILDIKDRHYIDAQGVERFGDNRQSYVLILQDLVSN